MQRNYEPLKSIVSNNDILNLKKQYGSINSSYFQIMLYLLLIISVIPFFVIVALLLLGLGWQYVLFFATLTIVIIVICIFIYFKYQNQKWTGYVRINRFAEANGLTFNPITLNTNYEGMIFNIGRQRKGYYQLTNKTNTIFEILNYKYTIGSGKSQREVKNGCIMIQLNRNLPHMVLDSKSNNTNIFGINLTNLPVSFKNNQRLSLEGDFDKYFTLYAPKEYERDALYVFTPDLMSLFIDESNTFDAEVVDNKLFIYSKFPFSLLDESVLIKIFKIIDTVGIKTISNTIHYADERISSRVSNVISEPGRRLKHRLSWLTIVIVIAYIFYLAFKIFIDK